MAHRRTISELSQLVALASGVVVIATLYFAKAVLVSFSLALLLSFLLTPLVRLLEKFRLAVFCTDLYLITITYCHHISVTHNRFWQ